MEKYKYAEIILPLALRQTYTYSIPGHLNNEISPGKRVSVQFGKRKIYTGLIESLHSQSPDVPDIKSIDAVLDDEPVVSSVQLKFWKWMAGYYMCTMGEIFKAALPHGLKLESESRVLCNNDFAEQSSLTEQEKALFDFLVSENSFTIQKIGSLKGVGNAYKGLQSLIGKKAVFVEEKMKDSYTPFKKKYFFLREDVYSVNIDSFFKEFMPRSGKQQEIVTFFLRADRKLFQIDEIQKLFSRSAIDALVKKNILIKKEEEELRTQIFEGEVEELSSLSNAQELAVQSVRNQFERRNVVLLQGVTSSGKTRIYIELIKEALSEGRQVLYLLPEIALTTQIVERLRKVFGSEVGIFHSKFNDSERVDVYHRQAGGKATEYKIILGVRSALFLPFRDLGLIVIDEEHENTFKQYDPAPRYHARDSAIVLGGLYEAKVLLGTATPSVESMFNAKSGKYGFVELNERFGGVPLPEIRVADLRKARLKKQMRSVFTPVLVEQINQTLANNKQVILFQNRRGYSSFIECEDCGYIPKCDKCDVSLTLHRFEKRLVCHYCGYSRNIPSSCPECNNNRLRMRGFGTELIEDEIALIFPDAKIARLDLDSTRSRKAYEKILGRFGDGETDILVGTQMLSKGLDFDNVELVGILNADQMLNYPDFRAYERSFQLMSQVSGRAGRKNGKGMVVIQASDPDHPVIKQVINYDYDSFYRSQVAERQLFRYPPYVRLFKIVIKSRDFSDGKNAAVELGQELRKIFGNRVLGPQIPVVGRIKAQYIHHILIKMERNMSFKLIRLHLNDLFMQTSKSEIFKKVRINVDVDPY